MRHIVRACRNQAAIIGILVTMVAVVGFDAYSTRASNTALGDLRHEQRAADAYIDLQMRIGVTSSAFFHAYAVPTDANYQALEDAVNATVRQAYAIRSLDDQYASEMDQGIQAYGGVIAAIQKAAHERGDLSLLYDDIQGVGTGPNLADVMLGTTAQLAEKRKASAEEHAAAFERSQDDRLYVTIAVNALGLVLVVWLAVVVRRFSKREVEMEALARAHRELELSKADAEKASHAKSEFLSRMSHELRTPMNAVLGFGQLLQMDDLSDEQRENVDYIMSSGRHLLRLIDEVLDISRIEAGKLDLSLEPFCPTAVVGDVVEMVRPAAATAGVELEVREAPELVRAVGDVQRTKQALLNLVSNAIKYNQPGGRVVIDVESRAGERVQIHVNDTGPGIEATKLDRLFSPFDRLGAENSGVEGTGLGLALSRVLVEAMSGALTVKSEVGRGSTFTIALPAAIVSTAETETASPTASGQLTVLYVEDNLANYGLLERALSQRGNVKLVAAKTGADGLRVARECRPDLILLDHHLPEMTGLEVLDLLKSDARTAAIPVAVLSADVSGRLGEKARKAGAEAFIAKPLQLADLFKLLDAVKAKPLEAVA